MIDTDGKFLKFHDTVFQGARLGLWFASTSHAKKAPDRQQPAGAHIEQVQIFVRVLVESVTPPRRTAFRYMGRCPIPLHKQRQHMIQKRFVTWFFIKKKMEACSFLFQTHHTGDGKR